MVGPDIWAESFGGGKASCRARTLSFSHRTSLPSRSIIGNGKSLRRAGYTNQNLTAAQSHTLPSIPADSMCAAQYAADPDVSMQWRYSCDRLFERNVSTRSRHAGFLDRCRQFCSDRQNEISAAPLQDVLEEAFSSAIRRCNRIVVRGADHCAIHSRRSRSRQTHDGLLGSLGSRRKQGEYGSG